MKKSEIFWNIIKYGFYIGVFIFALVWFQNAKTEEVVKLHLTFFVLYVYGSNYNTRNIFKNIQSNHEKEIALLSKAYERSDEAAKHVGYMYNVESQRIKEKYK